MSLKQFSTSSPALPGSSFPASENRQPVTAPVLILCLLLLSLLSLLMRETEVTLTCIGAILSLSDRGTGEPGKKTSLPEPTGSECPGYSLMLMGGVGGLYKLFLS